MGYLTAKQFSDRWGISERRIVNLCKENRISGAVKSGMIWKIPEETLKPSDKRSIVYEYMDTQKRMMIVNPIEELKEYLFNLLGKEGYIVDCEEFDWVKDNLENVSKYYEGFIYFPVNNVDKDEELFIKNFSKKLYCESSIVIVDYDEPNRTKIEKKLADKLKNKIGLKINALVLDIKRNKDSLVDYHEIAKDIIELLIKFKNTTGMMIKTDGGKIEFNEKGRTENLETGKFYKAINHYFGKLNKDSHLWCASTMLEDEWTEEPQEMKFRLLNLEMANRGVKVERIFIFSQSKIKEFKENKTLKIYMQSNIKTLFVDYDRIKQVEPKLLEVLGNGWDGIDKSTLIVDLPEKSKGRGYISKNTEEVLNSYKCFQKLKKYSKSLKEVLK